MKDICKKCTIIRLVQPESFCFIASNQTIDEKEIFGNQIYERLIGSYEAVNQKVQWKL